MISADQILAHMWGDYILQSDWAANNKTNRSLACFVHVLLYAVPFLFLRPSLAALLVIVSTHFVIDRWRLARYVVWAKNFLGPVAPVRWIGPSPEFVRPWERRVPPGYYPKAGRFDIPKGSPLATPNPPFDECRKTGYPADRPDWLATWLLIIADNILHVTINGVALYYL